jgi:hypothetical protein
MAKSPKGKAKSAARSLETRTITLQCKSELIVKVVATLLEKHMPVDDPAKRQSTKEALAALKAVGDDLAHFGEPESRAVDLKFYRAATPKRR